MRYLLGEFTLRSFTISTDKTSTRHRRDAAVTHRDRDAVSIPRKHEVIDIRVDGLYRFSLKMNFERDLLVFVVFMTFSKSMANEKESVDLTIGTQRYCGRNLINILTMVCDGIYNSQTTSTTKEGHDANSLQKLRIPQFREKRSVVTIFQRSNDRRRKRGAYDECCRKGCTLDEMVGYCGAA